MRILQIITRCQLRGAEIFACQLSEALTQQGVVCDIAFLYGEPTDRLNFPLNFISLQATSNKRFWDIRGYRQLNKLVRTGKYDLVQANAGDTLKYAVFSKWLFRWKPPIVFRNANKMSDFMKGGLQKWLNRKLLNVCHHTISVSENCRQDIIGFLPSLENRSTTIPIGTYDFEAVKARFREHSDEPLLIAIGSLVPEKNHSFLIDVFDAYYKKHKRGYLVILGEGKLRYELEQKVTELKLSARVQLPGAVPDSVAWLKSADVLLMPSKIEGLPGVILEALSCKVPVIASPVGGIPEVITTKTGWLVPADTRDLYVQAIDEVFSENGLREKRCAAGKALVLKQYNVNVVASHFQKIYEDIQSSCQV